MHVVVIHHDLFFQGGQYVAAKLAEGFFARGYEVDVIVSQAHADQIKRYTAEKAFQLPAGVGFHILPSRSASRNVRAMGRLLRELKPDVIIPNSYHYNLCVYLAKKLYGLKTPVVYVEHCLSRCPGWKQKLRPEYWIARRSMRTSARIVAVTDRVKACVESAYGIPRDKVIRIYNPVFTEAGMPKVQEEHLHPLLSGEHPYTVVGAGALCKLKDFSTLIAAFAEFRKKITNSQLLIFGRDSLEVMEPVLREQIRSNGLENSVVLAGYTEFLKENLQRTDMFVMTSRSESFGIVIVEALAAGNAVISTDCPVGPREILKDGRLGQLVPVGDVKALAEAMERAYRREYVPTESFSMREYVLEYVLDRYEEVVKEVL